MNTAVTLTKNYTLSFPKETRQEFKKMGYTVGQKFVFIKFKGIMYLVPAVEDIKKMRGTLKGLDTRIEREEEERL